VHLWSELGQLRLAAVTPALLFGAFTAFWSILALYLQTPRFGLGSEIAGLFGIVGAIGILAAPIAGRYADMRGPHQVIVAGTLLTVVSWIVLCVARGSRPGDRLHPARLCRAERSRLQHIVYALRPEARSRLNTIFMGSMFLGGAGGAAASTSAWNAGGWTAVSALGIGLALLASALQLTSRRKAARTLHAHLVNP